jgi:hypothetical protein
MSEYTIGEVFRLGLLKNQKGEPYKDKASVRNVLSHYPHKDKQTPHGPAKIYSEEVIKTINKRWK